MSSFQATHFFDKENSTQHINDKKIAFHCNHYSRLYTQLACDADEMFGGKQLLIDAAEETFYQVLTDYFNKQDAALSTDDKAKVAQEYFAYSGLGMLQLHVSDHQAVMQFSHIDEAWKKQWGNNEQPINFVGRGFIAAAFAAINQEPVKTYSATEESSIVQGAETSVFSVSKSEA